MRLTSFSASTSTHFPVSKEWEKISHAPDEGFDLMFSHPDSSSTCFLVYSIVEAMCGAGAITRRMAESLYVGMMTDTGGFTYNSNNPEIYTIISLLLTKGIDKDQLYRNVFNNYTESRIRLMGYVLFEKLRFLADGRASLFTLTRSDLENFHYIRGDAEGFVNLPLQVKGNRLSISLREDTETELIRVSLRSVGDFPCNRMAAEFFNGGGHANASGGRLPWPMESAIASPNPTTCKKQLSYRFNGLPKKKAQKPWNFQHNYISLSHINHKNIEPIEKHYANDKKKQ